MIVLGLVLITSTMSLVKSADQPGDDMDAYFQNHLRQPSRDNNVAISDPGNRTDTVAQNVTADTIELDVTDDDQPSDVMELNSWNSWADELRWEVEDARIPMELTSPIDMRYLQ